MGAPGGALRQQCAETMRRQRHRALLRAYKTGHTESAERRIQAEFAKGDLFPVKRLVILRGRQLQHRVPRHRGLDQRSPRQFCPAAPPDDLGHQTEHVFIGAEPLPSVTFSKSRPLATIWVPSRMS